VEAAEKRKADAEKPAVSFAAGRPGSAGADGREAYAKAVEEAAELRKTLREGAARRKSTVDEQDAPADDKPGVKFLRSMSMSRSKSVVRLEGAGASADGDGEADDASKKKRGSLAASFSAASLLGRSKSLVAAQIASDEAGRDGEDGAGGATRRQSSRFSLARSSSIVARLRGAKSAAAQRLERECEAATLVQAHTRRWHASREAMMRLAARLAAVEEAQMVERHKTKALDAAKAVLAEKARLRAEAAVAKAAAEEKAREDAQVAAAAAEA
jgi:hypothetical protein